MQNRRFISLALAAAILPLSLFITVKMTAQTVPYYVGAVIVDNQQNDVGTFTFEGGRYAEHYRKYFPDSYLGNNYHSLHPHSMIQGKAEYSYVAPASKTYEVGVSYPRKPTWLDTARYIIVVNGREIDSVKVKQGESDMDTIELNKGEWVKLGQYALSRGDTITVRQIPSEDRKWTVADAAYFVDMNPKRSIECSDGKDNDNDGYIDYLSFDVRGEAGNAWQRFENRFDVNGDKVVNGRDVEIVTLSINNGGSRVLGPPPPETLDGPSTYARVDVNGDGRLSSSDVNALNTVLAARGMFSTPDPDCESENDNTENNEEESGLGGDVGDNDDNDEDDEDDGDESYPACGDGFVESPEQCDDENQNDNDYCSNNCRFTLARKAFSLCAGMTEPTDSIDELGARECLQGWKNALGTSRENGNLFAEFDFDESGAVTMDDYEPLRTALALEGFEYLLQCGDGVRQDKEECDDGNTLDFDMCSSTCTIGEAEEIRIRLKEFSDDDVFEWNTVIGELNDVWQDNVSHTLDPQYNPRNAYDRNTDGFVDNTEVQNMYTYYRNMRSELKNPYDTILNSILSEVSPFSLTLDFNDITSIREEIVEEVENGEYLNDSDIDQDGDVDEEDIREYDRRILFITKVLQDYTKHIEKELLSQ